MARTLMRFTGVGGQGVLLAGEIFAAAKIKTGGNGLKTATYTSQVRGGPTVVDITLDDDEIYYPYANDGEINFMLSVAQVSYDQFKKGVQEGGTIVIDPNLVKPSDEDRKKWNIIEIPIITIAKEEVGNVITQSVVALAIANTIMKPLDREVLIETMLSKVPAKVHDVNKVAYDLGEKYALEAVAK
ncbi:2-oxoacid:acceptor oxidoreductase family protein [Sulfurimonas xiamenensis]|uniref:2-oxoglutarate:acceptor oxidoreductase n=1 Tax=Sulfurimonas xiamenensis TaxID=2590021 RepID=A0AAJ4A3U8_9BACT|nr:2-oxoacid:acceptor oxidoreductase family protein [Sulfurimonas xiamenensis]QFR43280.1 2-oxoglutarate:acceptor oxidoreductase [Sulfurimonas xiamenensis]